MAKRMTAWLDDHLVNLPAPVSRESIVGLRHVMTEVQSLLGRLQHPEAMLAMGAEVPRGILLYGMPGVGKTLVARYIAGALGPGVPMYELSADELTPPRIRWMFRYLGSLGHRSILYIDEIDLVGMHRGWESHSSGTRAILVALLAGLDGLATTSGPILIASSNRPPEHLDPALTRHGRLGFRVRFAPPDQKDREQLFTLFLTGRPVSEDIRISELATMAAGSTPAAIRQAIDDATGLALGAGRRAISHADLEVAIRRDGRITEDQVEPHPDDVLRVAIHEAGHVSVAVALRGADYVQRVTITGLDGSTLVGDEGRAQQLVGADALIDQVTVGMGGIEAETLAYGSASLGGDGDFRDTTRLIHQMAQQGLLPGVDSLDISALGSYAGPIALDSMDMAIPPVIVQARDRAAQLVAANSEAIHRFAHALIEAGGALVGQPLLDAIEAAGFAGPNRPSEAEELPATAYGDRDTAGAVGPAVVEV